MLSELRSLKKLFDDHSSALLELGESLRRQKQAVVHWDLEVITKEQRIHNQLIVRLRVFDAARRTAEEKISQKLGYRGRMSLKSILQTITDPLARDIQHAFDNLIAIAGSVKELYQENQKYLSHALEGVEMSLSVLQSKKQSGLYEANNKGAHYSQDNMKRRFLDQSM